MIEKNKNTATLIYTWPSRYGKISLVCVDGKTQVMLEQNNHCVEIPSTDVSGIPQHIATSDLAAYLNDTYVTVSSLGNSFHIEVQARLKGGANTISPQDEREKLWAQGIVPYEIDLVKFPVEKKERAVILRAIKEWNAAGTGFTVIPRSREEQIDYLVFGEHADACCSHVGRQGGPQYIRCALQGNGFNAASIQHEIAHAVGFYHEQQRADRDEYVQIAPHAKPANYEKIGKAYGRYDFSSIMHYPFSAEMQPQPAYRELAEQKALNNEHLTEGDISASSYLASFAKKMRKHSTTVSFRRHPAGLFTARSALVLTTMEQIAAHVYCDENYAKAGLYFSALYNEYKSVVSRGKRADWCNKYGSCAYHEKDFEQAKIGFQKALQHCDDPDQHRAITQNLRDTEDKIAQKKCEGLCKIL
jgi:hypothetical protein